MINNNISLTIEGEQLVVDTKNTPQKLSIDDLVDFMTELNSIHTEMVLNRHRGYLERSSKKKKKD